MTEKFVASNGVTVIPDGGAFDGFWIGIGATGVGVSEEHSQALREFFLHERDTELGRWRSKAHPECVVYPTDVEGVSGFSMLNELTGGRWHADRPNEHIDPVDIADEVFLEYFDTHPAKQPWHDAKPGEVWVLTVDIRPELTDAFYVAEEEGLDHLVFKPVGESCPLIHLGLPATAITFARRIYPEVSGA